MEPIGKKLWLIPDMYWPEVTTGEFYVSHESVCVLNTTITDCLVNFTFYYEDKDPVSGCSAWCPAMRTHHIRMDKMLDSEGQPLSRGIPYAAVVECSVPVVVQYTRVDTTQKANALMTTIGYPV